MINNKRQEKILNILLENKRVLTGEEICMAVGVSSRTVRSDVKELNYLLEKQGGQIISEKGRGYYLSINCEKSFNSFLESISAKEKSLNLTSEERAEYILFRLLKNEILGKEGVTLGELADELYISLSSLKNDLKILKERLGTIDIDIIKISNKGIKIEGNEEKIRSIINRYLFDRKGKFVEEFKRIFYKACEIEKVRLNEILIKTINNNNLILSDVAYESLLNHIATLIIRENRGYKIGYEESTLEEFKGKKRWSIAYEIWTELNNILNLPLKEEECAYITKYIDSSSTLCKNAEVLDEEIEGFLKNLLEEIRERLNVDFRGDKILEDFLGMHLKASLNRAKYGIKIENSMLSVIKGNYPFAFEIGILSNEIIKREKGVALSEDDIGFLALHFEASLERNKAENGVKRVIVVCTTGLGTSLLLKVKLESAFKNKLKVIDTIPWYEFKEESLEEIDFVLSTIPLKVDSSKVIYIKNLLDKNEIRLIEERLERGDSSKKSLISSFRKDLYIKNIKGKNRNDIILNMGEKLINKGFISNVVLDEILKREEIASTEIGNLVAIPHVMHEDIDESFIMVGILNKGVLWDKEQVQVVLLIGMANKDKHNWKGNLEKIYRSIIELDVVLNIIRTNDFSEFIQIIKEF